MYEKYVLLTSLETNTYLVWDEASKEAMLIDPAAASPRVAERIRHLGLTLKYIVNTHGHYDHIGGNDYFRKQFGAIVAIHEQDKDKLTDDEKNLSYFTGNEFTSEEPGMVLTGQEELLLGTHGYHVLNTPGHTKGGISLYDGDLVFTGDTLFQEDVGRTDLPGGDESELRHSVTQVLFKLPEQVVVLPGHGPSSTIGDEKVGNLFYGLVSGNRR